MPKTSSQEVGNKKRVTWDDAPQPPQSDAVTSSTPDTRSPPCPFFSTALAGTASDMEMMINAALVVPEDQLLYPNTRIIDLPHLALAPCLRLIDHTTHSTLLHFAAMNSAEMVKVILDYGLDMFINAKNSQGCTPIFLACGRGKLDVVKVLLQHGAHIDVYTQIDSTILHSAVLSGNIELVKFLLSLPSREVVAEVLRNKNENNHEEMKKIQQSLEQTTPEDAHKLFLCYDLINHGDDYFMTPLGSCIQKIYDTQQQIIMMQELRSEYIDEIIQKNHETLDSQNGLLKDKFQAEQKQLLSKLEQQQKLQIQVKKRQTIKQRLKHSNHQKSRTTQQQSLVQHDDHPEITTEYIEEQLEKLQELHESEQEKHFKDQEAWLLQVINADDQVAEINNAIEIGEALIADYIEIITFLFKNHAKVIHLSHISYWFIVIETGILSLIKIFLASSQVDVNWTFQHMHNISALHYAVNHNNLPLVELLLSHGADVGHEIDIDIDPQSLKSLSYTSSSSSSSDAAEAESSNSHGEVHRKDSMDGSIPPQYIDAYELLVGLCKAAKAKVAQLLADITPPPTAHPPSSPTSREMSKQVHTVSQKVASRSSPSSSLISIAREQSHHHRHPLVAPRQGVTCLVTAILNNYHDIALVLLKRGIYACGPTYLKTHHISSRRALLSIDVLETLEMPMVTHHTTTTTTSTTAITTTTTTNSDQTNTDTVNSTGEKSTGFQTSIQSVSQLLQFLSPFSVVTPLPTAVLDEITQSTQQKSLSKEATAPENEEEEEKNTTTSTSNTPDEESSPTPLPDQVSGALIPDILRLALQSKSYPLVHELLTLGVDIESPYFIAKLSMIPVPHDSTQQEYEYILTIDLSDVDFSPLFVALKHNQIEAVQQLLSIGVDITATLSKYFMTYGIDIMKYHLLPLFTESSPSSASAESSIASPSQRNTDISSNHHTSDTYNPQISVRFSLSGVIIPPLIQSIQSCPGVAHMLIMHGADINQSTSDQRTALHYATELNTITILSYLLDIPQVQYTRDVFGITPLGIAVNHDNYESAALLFKTMRRYGLFQFGAIQQYVQKLSQLASPVPRHAFVNAIYYPSSSSSSSETITTTSFTHSTQIDDVVVTTALQPQDAELRPTDVCLDFNFLSLPDDKRDDNTDTTQTSSKSASPSPSTSASITSDVPSATGTPHIPQYPLLGIDDGMIKTTTLYNLSNNQWGFFDVTYANFLAFYYSIENNAMISSNDHLLHQLSVYASLIDGITGDGIRSFRLACRTGSVLSVKMLFNLMKESSLCPPPLVPPTPPQSSSNDHDTPTSHHRHPLWVELLVPTEQQLENIITTSSGYSLLPNNIILDSHGFIVRNVTAHYASRMNAPEHMCSHRLCLPLHVYLATEALSTVAQHGFTLVLSECLFRHGMPLLNGVRGSDFIRIFHQYYMVLNNGVIRNRVPAFPFNPKMITTTISVNLEEIGIIDAIQKTNALISSQTKSKSIQTGHNKSISSPHGGDKKQSDDSIDQLLAIKEPIIRIYKTNSFSPLHAAIINDHDACIRLLLGLPLIEAQSLGGGRRSGGDGETATTTATDASHDNPHIHIKSFNKDDDMQFTKPYHHHGDGDAEDEFDVEEHKDTRDYDISPYDDNNNDNDDDEDDENQTPIFPLPTATDIDGFDYDDLAQLGQFNSLIRDQLTQYVERYQSRKKRKLLEQWYHKRNIRMIDVLGSSGATLTQPVSQQQQQQSQKHAQLKGKNKSQQQHHQQQQQHRGGISLPELVIPRPYDPLFQMVNRYAREELLTPLHLCALYDLAEPCHVLIQQGALVNACDEQGNTPLHYAVRDYSRFTLATLLQHQANVNHKNKDGVTPLFLAASLGYIELAKLMIEYFDGDVTCVDNENRSVQDMMLRFNDHDHDESLSSLPTDGLQDGEEPITSAMKLKSGDLIANDKERRRNIDEILFLQNELQKLKRDHPELASE